MLMVISNSSTRKTPALSGLDRMGIIKAQQSFSIPVMQGQTVFNAMRTIPSDLCKFPGLDLYPASLVLGKDLTIEIQQVLQSLVFTHDTRHSLMIIIG